MTVLIPPGHPTQLKIELKLGMSRKEFFSKFEI